MSTAIDRTIAPIAKNAIDRFGKQVVLTHRVAGAYDDAAGTATISTSTYSVKVVLEAYSERLINGTSILTGDMRATLAKTALAVAPAVDDEMLIDGVKYRVINVMPIYSGEDVAIYTLQIRS